MVLPYPVNSYGSWTGPASQYSFQFREQSNGAVYQSGTWSHWLVRHKRQFPSINRRRPIPGTFTPWIPPSNYERYVERIDIGPPGDFRCRVRWYLKNSPLSPSSANAVYTTRKVFRPGSPFNGLLQLEPNYNSDISNSINEADVKALLDLANGKANMGETLATSKQTLDLFLDTAIDLAKIARSVRRGQFFERIRDMNVHALKRAVRDGTVAKQAANKWLQFWFGWKPLVGDAYGLYEQFVASLQPALLVHGRASSTINREEHAVDVEDISSSQGTSYDFLERYRVDVRTNLTGRVNSAEYLRTINQVGLLNPLQTAWELIPFSFVVDWFLPIGKVLEAMSAPAGLTFVGGHRTVRHIRRTTVTVSRSFRMGQTPYLNCDSFGFKRAVLTTFPRPTPYVRSFHKSTTRFATMAALLVQLAK